MASKIAFGGGDWKSGVIQRIGEFAQLTNWGDEPPNVACEVLRKLLVDELKSRAKRNIVQSKALIEMLESSIKRYRIRF